MRIKLEQDIYICEMIDMIKSIAKLTILVCLVLCSAHEVKSQEIASQAGKESFLSELASLDSRMKKLSSRQEKAYSTLLSRLYSDRLSLMSNIRDLEDRVLNETKEKQIETQQEINKAELYVVEINSDIDLLTTAYQKNTTKNQLREIMGSIDGTHRSTIPSKQKEKSPNWDDEFSYLDIETTAYEAALLSNNDCQIVFDGVDPNSLQRKVQTNSENLISYTHKKLESYYKDQSFLTGDVSLVKLGKDKFLVLEILVRSRDAIKNYGIIQVGSPMKFELLNGESAYLFAYAKAEGVPVPQTNQVRYQVFYFMNKSEYKRLRKSEIDTVGIMWTSGYEKYEVYNLDVLQRQITCIEPY